MEALHLPHGTRVQRGLQVLCAAAVLFLIIIFRYMQGL